MLRSLAISLSRQRWLPYKTRRSIIKRINPSMLRDFAFETEFFGLKFRGNIVNYIDRLVYFCGAHEKYMLFLLRNYVQRLQASDPTADRRQRRKPVFVDVGANAGNHALFMSRVAGEVHAFEPFERVRKQLEDNIAVNVIANIRVYPFGLSDKEAVLPFYAAPESNLGAASFFSDHKDTNYYLGDMQLKVGDEVLAGMTVDIIKADVEGYEKFVLAGLKQTMMRDRPLCIIELSPKTRETLGVQGADALRALFPDNYKFYYFASGSNDTGRYKLRPFDYARVPKIQDVIACPEEKTAWLG